MASRRAALQAPGLARRLSCGAHDCAPPHGGRHIVLPSSQPVLMRARDRSVPASLRCARPTSAPAGTRAAAAAGCCLLTAPHAPHAQGGHPQRRLPRADVGAGGRVRAGARADLLAARSVWGEPNRTGLTPARIPTVPHRSATLWPFRATSPSTFSCFASGTRNRARWWRFSTPETRSQRAWHRVLTCAGTSPSTASGAAASWQRRWMTSLRCGRTTWWCGALRAPGMLRSRACRAVHAWSCAAHRLCTRGQARVMAAAGALLFVLPSFVARPFLPSHRAV